MQPTPRLSALYLAVVVHYSVDELFTDEWDVVPMVHAALHGQLTLSTLWAQHGENRMLVPNVGFVALGVATHDNPRADVALSWVVNIASFGVFLALCRSSLLRRPLTAPFVLAVRRRVVRPRGLGERPLRFSVRLVADRFLPRPHALAVARVEVGDGVPAPRWRVGSPRRSPPSKGSHCGRWELLCLLWIGARRRHLAWWVGATAVALGLLFLALHIPADGLRRENYVFFGINTASVSPTYALRHPVEFGHFILVLLGKVVPTESLALSTLIGAVVLIAHGRRRRRLRSRKIELRARSAYRLRIALRSLHRRRTDPRRRPRSDREPLHDAECADPGRHCRLRVRARTRQLGAHVRSSGTRRPFRAHDLRVRPQQCELFQPHAPRRAPVWSSTVTRCPRGPRHCFAVWGFFLDVNVVPVTQSWLFDEAQADHLGAFGAPFGPIGPRGCHAFTSAPDLGRARAPLDPKTEGTS